MVIGSLLFCQRTVAVVIIVLAFICPALRAVADDQIVKTDGTVISGHIISVIGDQVLVKSTTSLGGEAKVPYRLSDIKSVSMAPPADVVKAEASGVDPSAVVAALQPEIDQFAGLQADWVVDAMARLAQAYSALGKQDQAVATYNQIDELYPGSKYHALAVAGKAEMSLKAGKINEALAAVRPIIDQANKDLAPSPGDGATYARAFLVYGDIMNAQKKPQQALEAYLTVKTMFYQNSDLVSEADRRAQALRDNNPGIGIE